MRAFADRAGAVYALYRSASEIVNRDIYLLRSEDQGRSFRGVNLHPWNVGQCVMSTEAFAEGAGGVLAAWETKGQVYWSWVNRASPVAAPGAGEGRKHPVVAANAQGKVILAWTEGMGWKKGGSLAWQVFDKNGAPAGEIGRADGVPAWSLVAVYARPDGGFTVVY